MCRRKGRCGIGHGLTSTVNEGYVMGIYGTRGNFVGIGIIGCNWVWTSDWKISQNKHKLTDL